MDVLWIQNVITIICYYYLLLLLLFLTLFYILAGAMIVMNNIVLTTLLASVVIPQSTMSLALSPITAGIGFPELETGLFIILFIS